jgi:hypothetical protein
MWYNKITEKERKGDIKMTKLRKYQVRQFGGRYPEFQYKEDPVYSVIMNVDNPVGTKVYEHKTFINMPYEEALAKANAMEKNNILPNMEEWEELDTI